VLERGLAYCADSYDAESQIEAAVEDMLLPGRGTGWVVYDADVSDYGDPGTDAGAYTNNSRTSGGYDAPSDYAAGSGDDDESEMDAGAAGDYAAPNVNNQSVKIDHVYFKDFLTSAGRKWCDR
jgi:hypothetical protein